MNLQVVFRKDSKIQGFTLIEVMLVIALMLVIGVFVSPVGISFYHSQLLNETSDGLTSVLRQAQSFSLSGKDGQAHGVRVLEEEYVLFVGDSYDDRILEEDVSFSIADAVSVVGPAEIMFSKLKGLPSATGTFTVSLGSKDRSVVVGVSGNIDG